MILAINEAIWHKVVRGEALHAFSYSPAATAAVKKYLAISTFTAVGVAPNDTPAA